MVITAAQRTHTLQQGSAAHTVKYLAALFQLFLQNLNSQNSPSSAKVPGSTCRSKVSENQLVNSSLRASMLARCSRSSLDSVLKAVHGKPITRLQTLLKACIIAFSLLLTVGLLMRLFVGFSERTAKLQMPLFLRSDTDIWSANLPHRHDPEWRSWLAQSGIHVSAIVFYGRRDFVRVLDPYLKRNLVSAGGLLEEVSRAATLQC